MLAELRRFEGARYVAGNLPLEGIRRVREALGDAGADHRRRPAAADARPADVRLGLSADQPGRGPPGSTAATVSRCCGGRWRWR